MLTQKMASAEINQMIFDNQKLVHFAINKYIPTLTGDDDIFQAGLIGLWKACSAYDASKGGFSTFAVHCIINEIRMELRNRARQQKFADTLSLDAPLYFDEESGKDIALACFIPDTENGYVGIDYDLSCLKNKLSDRDIDVLKLHIRGYSATEIGKVFGLTRSWASATIKKAQTVARRKFCYT